MLTYGNRTWKVNYILYSEDEFVIASKPSENSDIKLPHAHAKLYDEVIISGKELKDGMVIG